MYFFKDEQLAADLHRGSVTEKDQTMYLLIYILIYGLFTTQTFGHMAYTDAGPLNVYDKIIDGLSIAVIFLSILGGYLINNRGNGRDMVSRYISLSFPIGVKSFLLAILAGGVTGYLDNPEAFAAPGDQYVDVETGLYTLGSYTLIYIYMLWRYFTCFQIAAGLKESK